MKLHAQHGHSHIWDGKFRVDKGGFEINTNLCCHLLALTHALAEAHKSHRKMPCSYSGNTQKIQG